MHQQELNDLGIEVKRNAGITKVKCPKCSQDRKNKSDPCLSVNIDKGLYNCHNCGWSGGIKFHAKPEYIVPDKENANVSERVLKWFEGRKITEPTLVHWKVGESLEYMPQVQKNRRAVNFNYYRENKLINVKYRDSEKNFKMVSGAELIFYGLDNIKDIPKVYIVEGEMDALSMHEAGIYSVCSVPNGASKGSQKLEYLDNCWKYFEDETEIIICTDNDDAGLMLRNELARRFGAYKCKYVDFGPYKDANEVLITEGAKVLRNYINNCKSFPLEGVLNIDNIWQDVLNYNEKGITNYSIGMGESDQYFKMAFGEWSVITGIPNS